MKGQGPLLPMLCSNFLYGSSSSVRPKVSTRACLSLHCVALASAGSWAGQLTDHRLSALGNGMDRDGSQEHRAEEEKAI